MTPDRFAEMMGQVPLAPGVHGAVFDTPEGIYIPIISADNPGSGDIGRYLNSLPRDRVVKFPCVLSQRLQEMLERRGFVESQEWCDQTAEIVPVMVRCPVQGSGN